MRSFLLTPTMAMIIALGGIGVAQGAPAPAQVDATPIPLLAYQGRLLEGSIPANGTRTFVFALRDATGIELWNSGPLPIAVVSGLYSVVLGSSDMPPIPATLLGRAGLKLHLVINDVPMIPDVDLVAAFQSRSAWELVGAFSGDVGGTQHNMLITKLQGIPLDLTTIPPTSGQGLLFNGTSWVPGLVTGAPGPQGPIGLTGAQGLPGSTGPQGGIGVTGPTGPQGLIGLTGAVGATGARGLTGLTGAIGPQGTQGPQGLIGLTGPTGAQGTIGLTGAAGIQGLIGLTGLTGPQGALGLTGLTGSAGATGAAGPQGTQGTIGLTGATGTQGPIGLTGSAGAPGVTGAAGPQGTQGIIGLTGPAGAQGTIGLTGSAGAPGATGAAGPQGTQGIIGLTGATGTQGPTGLTGSAGAIGAAGPQGLQGLSGANGLDGKTILSGNAAPGAGTGVDGDFYIDTAANLIYGPKAAGVWPAGVSLVGPTGLTGTQGSIGLTGATGPQGTIGATGVQGTTGLTGDTGIQGPTGLTGSAGATGAAGPQGTQGIIGLTGATGTQGPTGLTGSAGAIGAAGPQGTQGIIGLTGATGTQGPTGLTGSAGAIGAAGPQGLQGLSGANGLDGKTVLSGNGVPGAGTGVDGDFYIDTAANLIYGPKAAGVWPAGVSLVGPTGPSAVMTYGDFYASMPGDNTATIAVGAPVLFPQNGPALGILRDGVSPSSFVLPNVGTYQVTFQVSVSEAGQLVLGLDSGGGPIEVANSVVGRAGLTTQIVGTSLLTTTAINSKLTLRNPAGNSTALTITPLAGGFSTVTAHLVILQVH